MNVKKLIEALKYVIPPCRGCVSWVRCSRGELGCWDYYNFVNSNQNPKRTGRHPTRAIFIKSNAVGKDELKDKMKWV